MTRKDQWKPRKLHEHALTAREHAELAAAKGRPVTDRPIGGSTAVKRQTDAVNSAVFADPDIDRAETLHEVLEMRRERERAVVVRLDEARRRRQERDGAA